MRLSTSPTERLHTQPAELVTYESALSQVKPQSIPPMNFTKLSTQSLVFHKFMKPQEFKMMMTPNRTARTKNTDFQAGKMAGRQSTAGPKKRKRRKIQVKEQTIWTTHGQLVLN